MNSYSAGPVWSGFKVCPFRQNLLFTSARYLEDHIHVNFYVWRVREGQGPRQTVGITN